MVQHVNTDNKSQKGGGQPSYKKTDRKKEIVATIANLAIGHRSVESHSVSEISETKKIPT